MVSSSVLPVTPVAFFHQSLADPSQLSAAVVSSFSQYVLSDCGVEFAPCRVAERANSFMGNRSMIVYRDHLRLGLRFPLCPELVDVFEYFGIVPAQLVPDSLASIMAFILFLRRKRIAWSLGLFGRFFDIHMDVEGYVVFVTCTSRLKIKGLSNGLQDWRRHYCWAHSPVDWPFSLWPRDSAVCKPSGGFDREKRLWGTSIDVRQYILDPDVLGGSLYPERFSVIGEERWRQLDEFWEMAPTVGLGVLAPEPPMPFVEVDSESSSYERDVSLRRGVPLVRDIGEGAEVGAAGGRASSPLPDTVSAEEVVAVVSGGGASALAPLSGPEGDRQPLSPPARRRRLTGKAIVLEAPPARGAGDPKVLLSPGGEMAHVHLRREWYPASEENRGSSSSMGAVLSSAAFDQRIAELSLERLRDESASLHAASWRVCDYYADVCGKQQVLCEGLKKQVADLKTRLLAAHRECQTARQGICRKGAELVRLQSSAADDARVQKAAYDILAERCRRQQRDLEDVADRRYFLMRSAIAFCTLQLINIGALSREWRDPDRVIALAQDPGLPSNVGGEGGLPGPRGSPGGGDHSDGRSSGGSTSA